MAEEKSPQQPTSVPPVKFEHTQDFESRYANNVQSEHSVWDFKVIFGTLDQSVQPNRVMQHTSINLPWLQVKLLSYYLNVAVAIHETENGKIKIPASVMPPNPETIELAVFGLSPHLREIIDNVYKHFMASL